MSLLRHQSKPGKPSSEVKLGDFRDHLGTADKDGKRRWVYAKKPQGRFYRWRTWVTWVLLGFMFIAPFVRINGNPLLLLNIVERRFIIFGQIFWPQDVAIFAIAMLLFFTAIMVFTSAFGRLWCGWACPHTLFQEMLFRKIDFFIEGDAREQRALDKAPWTAGKIRKKLSKHALFIGISFLIANLLLSYIIGTDQLFMIVTDDPRNHVIGLISILLFTALFYAIFARFREQACTFICPYGRLQSAVLDENSLVVAYDHKRGEKRGGLHRDQTLLQRVTEGFGDCVNCQLCVAVCPTAIDIRNGTQMECVNCTACIDACDSVMDKIKRPRGLIRYASLNSIERGERFKFTARMGWYSVLLVALAGLLAFLVFTRSDVEATLLRAPGALFQQTSDGNLRNLYTLKVVNKTSRDIPLTLKLENADGTLSVMGGSLTVTREQLAQTSVLIDLPAAALTGAKTKLVIGVYSNDTRLETLNTVFIGPRDASAK